ncbi:MAG: ABC transporter substrate-binding protein [Thermodesulfobacteriota bacterium]
MGRSYTDSLDTAENVISTKARLGGAWAGIQEETGCRIKSGMTNDWITGSARRPLLTIALLFTLLTVFAFCSCSRGDHSGKVETVTIGVPALEQNALLYVADHKTFFADHGLRVVIKDYDSGVTALNGMLKGEADIAGAAEFPFVRAIFQNEKILIIACTDKFENDYIAGRKDRGIKRKSDLKGKRIGLTLKTINEFYLGRFLALNGMEMKEVTLVDLAPGQYVNSIADGKVDAIISWQPYIHRIQKEVKGVVVWPAQSSQAVYGVLVCSRGWLTEHAGAVNRFLKSLREAEEYLLRHPDEARAIVQKRLNYEDSYMASVWPQHHFSLSLDQTLIVAMKDEAQWMINNSLASEKEAPDFTNFIYRDGLKAINPEAVNIIR